MKKKTDISRLESQVNKNSLPPIEKWDPPFCGDLDMRIARDGTWYYLGSSIKRPALVRLFSSILLRQDNEFFLVTPVEKYRIQVDDAPFVAIAVNHQVVDGEAALEFETNVGDKMVLNADHPLHVLIDPQTAEPSPYILVRKNLEALISRNVFYQLVDHAEVDGNEANELFVSSCGARYSLGRF